MAVSCSNCGGSHPVWDCRSKSTAARKDVLEVQAIPKEPRQGRVSLETKNPMGRMASDTHSGQAGTQVLPVDINPGGDSGVVLPKKSLPTTSSAGMDGDKDRQPNLPDMASSIPGSLPVAAAESNAEITGREPRSKPAVTAGETAPKFDKKSWSREYMAGYMKQYRAEVKAGTRIPKRKGEK